MWYTCPVQTLSKVLVVLPYSTWWLPLQQKNYSLPQNGGYPPSCIFKAGKNANTVWFHISNLIERNCLGVHVLHILLMDKILHHLEWTKSFPNHTFRHVRSFRTVQDFVHPQYHLMYLYILHDANQLPVPLRNIRTFEKQQRQHRTTCLTMPPDHTSLTYQQWE